MSPNNLNILMLKLVMVVVILCTDLLYSSAQIWDSVSTDLRGPTKHFHEYNGQLFVGIHDTVDTTILFNIGVWDGNLWSAIDSGVDGKVYGSAYYNNKLFLGGYFTHAGGPYPGPPIPHICSLTSWDGQVYTDYSFPCGTKIEAVFSYQNELYLGLNSSPATINGQTMYGITRFNDTIYNDVAGGVVDNFRTVRAFEKFNGNLILGGRFIQAGTVPVNNIAAWNGSQYFTLGNGLNSNVLALCVDTINNFLYAGGSFTNSDTTVLNYVAKWDGISWSAMGTGIGEAVTAICLYKGEIYVGTNPNFGGTPSSLLKWDGINWIPIFPFPNGVIRCLKVYQGKLFVGGDFDEIGGVSYAGLAIYQDTTVSNFVIEHDILNVEIYPNPTSDAVMIQFSNIFGTDVEIKIYDLNGNEIHNSTFNINSDKVRIEFQNQLKAGIYLCLVQGTDINTTLKFVINK